MRFCAGNGPHKAVMGGAVFAVSAILALSALASGPAERLGLSGKFFLTIGGSGKCLTKARGANMGRQFHAWTCKSSGDSQEFTLHERAKGWYLIATARGRMCLDVSGSVQKNGAPVVHWSCLGNPNQLWQIVPAGGSRHFQLRVSHSGKCLHLDHAGGNNATFVQRDCRSGDAAQTFSTIH